MAAQSKMMRLEIEGLLISNAHNLVHGAAGWLYARPVFARHNIAPAEAVKLLKAWRAANEKAVVKALDKDDMDAMDKAQFLQEQFNGMVMGA